MSNEAFVLVDITQLPDDEVFKLPDDADELEKFEFKMASPSSLSDKGIHFVNVRINSWLQCISKERKMALNDWQSYCIC